MSEPTAPGYGPSTPQELRAALLADIDAGLSRWLIPSATRVNLEAMRRFLLKTDPVVEAALVGLLACY